MRLKIGEKYSRRQIATSLADRRLLSYHTKTARSCAAVSIAVQDWILMRRKRSCMALLQSSKRQRKWSTARHRQYQFSFVVRMVPGSTWVIIVALEIPVTRSSWKREWVNIRSAAVLPAYCVFKKRSRLRHRNRIIRRAHASSLWPLNATICRARHLQELAARVGCDRIPPCQRCWGVVRTACTFSVTSRTSLLTSTLIETISPRSSGFSRWHWRRILGFHRGNYEELKSWSKRIEENCWRHGMGILALNADERVRDVRISRDTLTVDLMDGRTISVPLVWYPRLLEGTPKQRSNWKICAAGYGIHWPDLDEDLSTEGLLRGAPAPAGTVRRLTNRYKRRRKARRAWATAFYGRESPRCSRSVALGTYSGVTAKHWELADDLVVPRNYGRHLVLRKHWRSPARGPSYAIPTWFGIVRLRCRLWCVWPWRLSNLLTSYSSRVPMSRIYATRIRV